MDSICSPSDISVNDVKVGALKTLSNGGKMAFLSHKEKQMFIQTPEQYAPFGVNAYTNDDTGLTKYTLELSFRNMEDRENLQTFMKFLTDMDELVINTAFENSQTWFKKKYSNKAVLEELYTSCLKPSRDKETGELDNKYPTRVKVSLPHRDGSFKLEAYDKQENEVDLNVVKTKGAKFVCILQCGGVWVAGGKFGLSWKVVQLQVTPPSNISGFSIKNVEGDKIEDGDDIDEATDNLNKTVLNDSDDEDV